MNVLFAVLFMLVLATLLGAILGAGAAKFKVEGNPLADTINQLLPQTQCGQCGFAGCKPYAEALASGDAPVNLCPPGGTEGIEKLANALGVDIIPFDANVVVDKPKMLAIIDENSCIGCTLCIQACPVDAILGSAKHMHTVIADECTGCELCLPPCPVDCIRMEAVKPSVITWIYPIPTENHPLVSTKPSGDVA